MVETNIPKDIRVYKTRVVGPLTLRQLICLCIAVALDGLLYLVFENLLHVPVRIFIFLLIFMDIPVMAFSIDVGGVPMEVYLKNTIIYTLLAPTKRKMSTKLDDDNYYMSDEERKKIGKKMDKLAKKYPEYKAYR